MHSQWMQLEVQSIKHKCAISVERLRIQLDIQKCKPRMDLRPRTSHTHAQRYNDAAAGSSLPFGESRNLNAEMQARHPDFSEDQATMCGMVNLEWLCGLLSVIGHSVKQNFHGMCNRCDFPVRTRLSILPETFVC